MHSSRAERTNRSAWGLQWGERGGILVTLMPSLAKAVSKAAVNFASRSRTRCVNFPCASAELPKQVAGVLGGPGYGWGVR